MCVWRCRNPFDRDYPEVVDGALSLGAPDHPDEVTCIAFNLWGTLLAGGTRHGACLIWDFETRGIARRLRRLDPQGKPYDSAAVSSVAWSRDGTLVLVGSSAGYVIQWDVLRKSSTFVTDFDADVISAAQHPSKYTVSVRERKATQLPAGTC